jgi:hypothetical protein
MNQISTGRGQERAEETPTSTIFHGAAKCSILFPVLGLLANGAVRANGEYIAQHTGMNAQAAQTNTAFLCGALILLGFLCGAFALCGMGRYGTKGILARSLFGILFNGAFLGLGLAIAIPTVLQVRARTKNASLSTQIDQAVHSVREDVQSRLRNGNPDAVSTNKLSADQEKELEKFLEKAAKEYTGDAGLALKGVGGFLRKAAMLQKNYDEKMRALIHPPVTSMAGVATREDIQARRTNVVAFFEASKRLKEFVKNSDSLLQEELKKQNVPADMVEKIMANNREKAPTRETLLKLWTTDQRMVAAMLGMLDALDQNWGKWHYDAASRRINFDSPDTLKYYNFYLSELQSSTAEATGLQSQLLAQLGK